MKKKKKLTKKEKEQLKKKRKLMMEKKLKNVQKTINDIGSDFTIPTNLFYNKTNTHSWFDLNIHNTFDTYKGKMFFNRIDSSQIIADDISSDKMKTMQTKLLLTNTQKLIIDKWFDMYILMFNSTTKYIKTKLYNSEPIPSLTNLKKILLDSKNDIENKSKMTITDKNGKIKNVKVDRHLLDYAINDALNRYRSCQTNLKNGNIKHFRLRYLKLTKPNKIIKIEKLAFRENTFYQSVLGDTVKCLSKNFNYSENIKGVAILTKRKNDYYLLSKHNKGLKLNKYKDETIGIDLGTNPMATGYTDLGVVVIGKNMSKQIGKKIKTIDKINNLKGFLSEKKLRITNKKYKRIRDMVNDMQWKVANYLTKNYKNIFIGNLSTKKMGEGKIDKRVKRIGNLLSICRLKQKIKYKGEQRGCKYKEIDEAYTTQVCGKCSYQKKTIGSNKTYKCDSCKITMNRDLNSARIITMLGTQKTNKK